MNLVLELSGWTEVLRPHVLAVALAAARIVPATLLCPLFGGRAVPATVRVALCLALSLHVHLAGGLVPALPDLELDTVAGAFARELLCGTVIGFVAALPFDAARMGGRLLDTFRGANGETSLPLTGSTEAATGDVLYQLLCALVFSGPLYQLLSGAVLLSFRAAPLGLPFAPSTAALAELAVLQATGALAAGLSIGAPAAAASLLTDLAVGVAGRIAPALNLREIDAPAKLLVGAAAVLLSLGALSQRLLGEVAGAAGAIAATTRAFGAQP